MYGIEKMDSFYIRGSIACFFTDLFYIISMLYISMPHLLVVLIVRAPVLGSALTSFGVKSLRSQGDRCPRAHIPPFRLARMLESPLRAWDRLALHLTFW